MNMNICIKKCFFYFAVLFILLLILISCGNNNNNNSPNEQNKNNIQDVENENIVTENLAGKDELPEKDFKEKEFIILVNPDPAFRHFYDICVEGMNGELVNDAVYKRNLEVEERFNVKITDRKTTDLSSSIKKNVSAGTVDFSIAWAIIGDYGKLSQQNMFLDINKALNINLEKIYWDQNVVRDFTINKKLYGIMGDISTSVSVYTHLLGLNRVVAQDNGIDIAEIYQSVRDGKWTLDRLYEIIKPLYKDIDGDGTRNYADAYGLGVSPAIVNAAFSASGEKFVTRDQNGDFILTQPTARIDSVLNKIVEITSDKVATITTWNIGKVQGDMIKTSPYEYVYYDKFINNTLLFADIDVGIVLDYRLLMDSDFGIVPLPKYEESQPNYSVYAYPFYPMLTIASSYAGDEDSIDFIGTVVEGLASASYKILTPAFYDTAFKTKYTRDEESIEMLDIILRSRIYDWMTVFDFGGLYTNVWNQLQKDNLNIVSIFEKYSPKAETDIQKLMNSYAEND